MLSEALWQEVEPLGIKVMLVEPSGFRTDWAGRSANESKRQIDDYALTAGAWRSQVRTISGKQTGDPVRAAYAIVKAIESENPPHRLLLGNEAYEAAAAKLDDLRKEFSSWKAVSRGADFPLETIQGFVSPKSRDWKAERQEYEKQSIETTGSAGAIHPARLHAKSRWHNLTRNSGTGACAKHAQRNRMRRFYEELRRDRHWIRNRRSDRCL